MYYSSFNLYESGLRYSITIEADYAMTEMEKKNVLFYSLKQHRNNLFICINDYPQ